MFGGLVLLFLGFCLMLLMRWQLAFPGQALTWANASAHMGYQLHEILYHLGIDATFPTVPVPIPADPNHPPLLQLIFGKNQMPGGVMSGDFYNTLGAMHGTIMVFFGIVPIGFAAFGNFAMPLQIGAIDMAFPRLNMGSVILFFISAVLMVGSLFCPGGAAKSGWTSYTPLSIVSDQPQMVTMFGHHFLWPMALTGQSMWIIALAFNITSSLLSSVNFITTIVQLRAKGLSWMRLPFFVWTQFVTAFLLLLAFPPLEAAALMQLMDRVGGSSLFSPAGLVVGGTAWHGSGGGTPLLWQHLFWFLGHPEVYVLVLPGLGIIAEVVSNNARKTDLGLQANGLRPSRSWLPLHGRLGPSHVSHRHGHGRSVPSSSSPLSSFRCRPSWCSARSSSRSGAARSALLRLCSGPRLSCRSSALAV